MAQIGNHRNLFALRYLCAHLSVHISQDGLAGRTYLCIVQGTLHFGQAFGENVEFKFLDFQVGCFHFLFVLVLLAELFQFQFTFVVGQFGLTHLVGCTRTDAVQIAFVAQFHLLAAQLHGTDFYIHGQVAEVSLVVHLQLFQLVALHLLFIQEFLVSRFRTL